MRATKEVSIDKPLGFTVGAKGGDKVQPGLSVLSLSLSVCVCVFVSTDVRTA